MAAATQHQVRAIATQEIEGHNACPICGFPLMWNLDDPTPPPGHSPDRSWGFAQLALKQLPDVTMQAATAFGINTRRNAEEFHLTDGYLTRDHAMARLYLTPPIGLMSPENAFYLRKHVARSVPLHQLFHFTRVDLRALFGPNLNEFQNTRFAERLAILTRPLLVTCSQCNENYKAIAELNQLYELTYGALMGENPTHENQFYTLMFDCLADPASFTNTAGQSVHIRVNNAERQRYWQCEVWLVRSCLLFLIQQCHVLVDGNRVNSANPDFRLRMGASHMGVCDFLMSQILAPVFYERFAIDYSFVDLHRRFLMRVVKWAKDNHAAPKLPATVTQPGPPPITLHVEDASPLLLWRWVLGKGVAFLNSAPNARDEFDSPNMYWMDITAGTFRNDAQLIKNRVMNFVQDWGPVIGLALEGHLPPPAARPALQWTNQKISLYTYFHRSLGLYTDHATGVTTDYEMRRRRVVSYVVPGGAPAPPLLNLIMVHHRIKDMEEAFRAVFGLVPNIAGGMPYFKRVMYHHLRFLTIPRMECYALWIFHDPVRWTRWTQALFRLMQFLN